MRLIAQTPLRHDGEDVPEGAFLDVPDAVAAALIAQGAALPAPDKPRPKKPAADAPCPT